jgi:hypothetical protein
MRLRQPFAHQRRQARLHQRDAETGHDRCGVKRPDIDRRAACGAGEGGEDHAEHDGIARTDPRNQQRSRHRRDRKHRQRQSDQKTDLGLRHVQFVMDCGITGGMARMVMRMATPTSQSANMSLIRRPIERPSRLAAEDMDEEPGVATQPA